MESIIGKPHVNSIEDARSLMKQRLATAVAKVMSELAAIHEMI